MESDRRTTFVGSAYFPKQRAAGRGVQSRRTTGFVKRMCDQRRIAMGANESAEYKLQLRQKNSTSLLGYDLEFLLTPFFGLAEPDRRLLDVASSSVRAPCGKTRSRKSPKSLISFASPPHQISCPTSAYDWKSMLERARPSGGGSRRMAIDVSASECLRTLSFIPCPQKIGNASRPISSEICNEELSKVRRRKGERLTV